MVDYNIEEIMKLPVEKRPKELENLAAQIMTPQMIKDYYEESSIDEFKSNEALLNYFNDYIKELTRFAFARKKNHREFRKFLSEHKMIFGDDYGSFKKMRNQQVNYVFARVREEQVGIVEKEFYEFLNSSK